MSKESKYEQLYQDLKKRIIKLSPGDKYPSMRTIMKEYSLSQATVSKASEKLFNEGFLEKFTGNGMVITEEVLKYKNGARPIIALAIPQWQSSEFTDLENKFYELREKFDFEIEIIRYDWRDKVLPELPPSKIDGLIIMPSASILSADEIKKLDSFSIPYVLLHRHTSGLSVNCVSADNYHMGALAANHLIELGHKSVSLTISQPKIEVIKERILGFKNMCELRNVRYTEIDCKVSSGDYCVEKVYEKFSQLLKSGRPEFTATFTMCQESCVAIYKCLYENGMKIPEDLSVIGIGNVRLYSYMYPPLTSLTSSPMELAGEAVSIIIDRISGKGDGGIVQKQVKPFIIEKESTGRCSV